ncbi:MAG: hypothetical protein DRO98_03990 [Archaeoglobales archaeon]|nr:MAG: hypothetical protein DRO98_03990 [Archaeoglobales archaeon]
MIKLILAAAIGLLVGVLGGMVGLVLGSLRLPAVYAVIPSPHIVAGTALGINTLSAFVSAAKHCKAKRIDPYVFIFMGSFSWVGAFLGGYFCGLIPAKILLVLIGFVLIYSGLTLLKEKKKSSTVEITAKKVEKGKIAGASFWGFVVGVIGGMVGLILGELRLPIMLKRLKMDPRIAAGTNVTIGFFSGLSGFAGHVLHGNYDLVVLVAMGLASMVGAYIGAHLTGVVKRETLTKVIGATLILIAILLIRKGLTL